MEKTIFHSDKILKHLDRVNHWLIGGNPYPVTVELDMTNQCNHACPDCMGTMSKDKSATLPGKIVDTIIELSNRNVKAITFTGGGEPLIANNTMLMIGGAKRLGIETALITNGSLLSQSIAICLVTACTWIRISLDAGSPEMYKETHGMNEDVWNKTLGKIKMLVDIKKKQQSNTTIGIGFLTRESTVADMLPATKIAKELGVDYIQFRPYHYDNFDIFKYGIFKYGYLQQCKAICENEIFKVICSYNKYEDIKEMHDNGGLYTRKYGKCYGHNFTTVIGADYKVYLCCHMRGKEKYCLGDLTKDTFETIWSSKRRKEVIKNIDFNDCPPFCRCDPFNKILWELKQDKEHVNFL